MTASTKRQSGEAPGHTPLPWVIAPACAFNDGGAHIIFPASETGVNAWKMEYVAECGHGDTAWADAALIVRAVNSHADLLAALYGAADALSSLAVSLQPESEAAKYADDEARKIGAAIARATGERK